MNRVNRQVIKRIFIFISIAVLVTAFSSLCLQGSLKAQDGRSFYFPSVITEAEILPDGSMRVTEQRTFRFTGRYTGAWYYIYPKHNASLTDILISEGGIAYEQVPVGTEGIPNTYYYRYEQDHVYIDFSYEAINEDRTFILSYLVKDAVQVHDDVAELYWQFIGDQSGERTSYARINLTLSDGAAMEEIRIWAHGPLQGEVRVLSPNSVQWEVYDLPGNTFLEGRVAFPLKLVPQAGNYTGKEGLPIIIAEETRWARQANIKRWLMRTDFIAGPMLLLIMLTYAVISGYKAKRSPTAYKGQYYRELAGDYSPAEAGYLVRSGRTTPEDFTATLMDLARRNHLKLEEYQGESGLFRKRQFTDYRVIPTEGKDTLSAHERLLHSFIFDRVAQGQADGTTMKDIEAYGKKQSTNTAKFYKEWTESIKKAAKRHQFFKDAPWQGIVAGVVTMVIGFILFFPGMFVTGMIAAFGGPFLFIGSALIKRLTPKGADHYAKWRAFKLFLQHFSRLDRSTIPAIAIWEHYLVYAVVLGVAKEVMEQLNLVYPELRENAPRLMPAYGMMASNPAKFSSFTSSMGSSFQTAFSSSMSSGSGGGGGFSGGGGGGGGGGGVGAR